MPSLVQATSSTFKKLFNGSRYQIPKFQRTFAWQRTHVNDFWEDLSEAMTSNKNHFFGSIVLQHSKSNEIVYDGQQRLTVVIALISIIAHALEGLNKSKDDNELNAYIRKLKRKYICDKKQKPYLLLTNQDKDYFRKCLLEPEEYIHDKAIRKSNEFLRTHVFRNLKDHVNDRLREIEDTFEKANYLRNLCDFVCDKIYFAVIFADKHFPAATLFEVLNYRGVTLQPSDLIKNLIYSKAVEQRCSGEIDRAWSDFLDRASKVSVNEFLRHFWILQNGQPLKGSLYKTMKRGLEGNVNILECVNRMRRHVDVYVDIRRPYLANRSTWNRWPEIKETLMAINRISAEVGVCYPFLMSLFSLGIGDEQLEFYKIRRRTLSMIENTFFRLMVCNKKTSYDLGKTFAEFSKRIKQNTIEELSELIKHLKHFSPDDGTFGQGFSTFNTSQRRLATYILYKLESYHRGRKEPISSDSSKVQIEHIMPQTLGRGWGNVGRYHKDYLNRLGNLTLLSKGLNKGNPSFTKKKNKFYKESDVILTKTLHFPNTIITLFCDKSVPHVCHKIFLLI